LTTKAPIVRIALAAAVLTFSLVPMALADKGGNSGTTGNGGKGGTPKRAPNLSLTTEYTYNSPNPTAPLSCLNEDDIDQRTFSGSLAGSYGTAYELCDTWNGGIYWSAGGEGLETHIASVGSPINDLVITSPTGDAHHAVLTGTTTNLGVTTYNYAACYVPPFSLSTNTGTDPLVGGTWTITLNGTFANATWTTTVRMAYRSFQQTYCPPSQQNLTP
jgi:hypothetical protein